MSASGSDDSRGWSLTAPNLECGNSFTLGLWESDSRTAWPAREGTR